LLSALCEGATLADEPVTDLDYEEALVECETTRLADSDYLTRSEGFVLRLNDGSEFIVTVQRGSR